jgi:hypothetical protein
MCGLLQILPGLATCQDQGSGDCQGRRWPPRHRSSSTGCISRAAETASLKPVYPTSLLSLSLSLSPRLRRPRALLLSPCSLPHAAPSSPARRGACAVSAPNRPAWHSEVATGPCRWPMPSLVARAVRGRARWPECPGIAPLATAVRK